MIEFHLRIKSRRRAGISKKKDLLAEFYKPNQIYLYLFNIMSKSFQFNKFIKIFNALVNHEMTHYFLKNYKIEGKLEENICEKMEVEKR